MLFRGSAILHLRYKVLLENRNISHKLLRPSQFLEKFWNGSLCRNKSGPSPYSMLQDIGRVATLKLVSRNRYLRYLQTTLIFGGGGGIGHRIYVRYCLKKQMKNKRGFGKTWNFFYLKPTILYVWDMSNGFMTNWVTP